MTSSSFTMYLARHGETEFNRKRLMQGKSIDAPLNGLGRLQAEALSDRLADVPLTAVYASPLLRARQTAEAVAQRHGLELRLMPSLAEMSWGSLEGRPIGELRAYLREVGADWRAGHFDQRVGGGESILDVAERAEEALAHLREAHGSGETILVVTHGRYLRVLLSTAVTGYGLTRMDEFPHNNAGLYRLEAAESGFSLSLHNDIAHLEHLNETAA